MRQFDRHADAYDAIRAKIAYPEALYERLAGAAPARRAALDLGCGTGTSTARLTRYFQYVEGADLGENLVAKARANHPNVVFRVSPAEALTVDRTFDVVTSATAFHWMDRDVVLRRCADWLAPDGVFCAYRYDFPVVYGPARDVIEGELAARWARHRDPRLIAYDDTVERLRASGVFRSAERFVLPNVLALTPAELALFFLSASFVTRYQETEGDAGYGAELERRLREVDPSPTVYVNFDVHAYWAHRA